MDARKVIFGLVGVFVAFAAWAAPEGRPLFCIAGNSPVPIEGFRPSPRGRIEMMVQLMPESYAISALFCARDHGKTVADRLSFGLYAEASQWHFHYHRENHHVPDDSDKTGRLLELSLSAKGGLVVNGEQVPGSAVDEADFVPGGDLVLLAAQEAFTGVGYANAATCLFYWAKVYDAEDNLVASFVPWMGKAEDGSDEPGVLDEETGCFHPPVDPAAVRGSEAPGHRLTWCATQKEDTYVDTGFVPPSHGRVEAKFALTPSVWPANGYFSPFCARANETNKTARQAFGVLASAVNGVRSVYFHYNGDYTQLDGREIQFFREMTISASAKDGIFVNGRQVPNSAVGAADFTVGGPIVLFAAPNVLPDSQGAVSGMDTHTNMRFYWLRVYDESNNLVASFVPWADDLGDVEICNEVTGAFLKPGQGTLHAGRTISAEMTGRNTAKVKTSAMPAGVCVLESDLHLRTVCDSEDKGDYFSAWAHKSAPVAISTNACEVEVAFPKAYKGANRFGRVFLAGPDALIGTGGQHVDLDRPLTDADGVEIVFSSDDVQQLSMIFGSRSAAGSRNFSILLNNGSANVDFCDDGNYQTYRQYCVLSPTNVYRVVVDKFRRATTNLTTGAEAAPPNTTENGSAFSQPGDCRIFGASSGAPAGYGNFKGRIHSFRVYETATGRTLYDLVPGLNADGEPCFVDTLTGKTYGNKGTGSFAGPFGSESCSAVLPPLKKRGFDVIVK